MSDNAGFVGYDKDGHFVHYCHCGKWGDFGYGVRLLKGELGVWYCKEHAPVESPIFHDSAPEPQVRTSAQGELF